MEAAISAVRNRRLSRNRSGCHTAFRLARLSCCVCDQIARTEFGVAQGGQAADATARGPQIEMPHDFLWNALLFRHRLNRVDAFDRIMFAYALPPFQYRGVSWFTQLNYSEDVIGERLIPFYLIPHKSAWPRRRPSPIESYRALQIMHLLCLERDRLSMGE